jgi:hypothetical protein
MSHDPQVQELEFSIDGYSAIEPAALKILERRAARARSRVFAVEVSEELTDMFLGSVGEVDAQLVELEFPITQHHDRISQDAADQVDSRLAKYEDNIACNTSIKLPHRPAQSTQEKGSG